VKLVNRAYGIFIIVAILSSNLISQQNIITENPEILSAQDAISQSQDNINILGNYPNRLKTQLQMLWAIDHWENSIKWENEYPNGKVSTVASTIVNKRTLYSWYSNDWQKSTWSEMYADDDGNNEKFVSYNSEGNANQEIYYNPPYTNGRPATTLSLLDNDGSGWENFWQTSSTYNTDGDIIELISENWDGSNWILGFRSIYTYVQPRCLATRTSYEDDNGTWVATYRSTYEYDNCISEMVPYNPWPLWNCNPTQVIDESTSDNGVTWEYFATYAYSNFGTDCLPRTYEYSNGFQERADFEFTQIPSGKVSSVYDNSNIRCTKKTTQNFTDGSWVNSTNTLYGYEGLEIVLDTKSETTVPDGFALAQNYPNPFNPSTNINFTISEESNIKLLVYDLSGKLIKEMVNAPIQIGKYSILWNGTDTNGNKVGAGVYLYKLQAENFTQTKKMILLK